MVDKEQLAKNFPEKWDLADPLPQANAQEPERYDVNGQRKKRWNRSTCYILCRI